MAIFEQHPPHIKKRIALVATLVVAALLVLILVFVYKKRMRGTTTEESPFRDFYNTLLDSTQSFLPEK